MLTSRLQLWCHQRQPGWPHLRPHQSGDREIRQRQPCDHLLVALGPEQRPVAVDEGEREEVALKGLQQLSVAAVRVDTLKTIEVRVYEIEGLRFVIKS